MDGVYVFTPVDLSVSLFVCEENISKSCGRNWTKFWGALGYVTRTKWFGFGEDPNPDPDLRFFEVILHHWEKEISQDIWKSYGRIQMKLGGWVGSVAGTSWLNFGSGPNPDPACSWDIKHKLISLAEVCSLPSALPVIHNLHQRFGQWGWVDFLNWQMTRTLEVRSIVERGWLDSGTSRYFDRLDRSLAVAV